MRINLSSFYGGISRIPRPLYICPSTQNKHCKSRHPESPVSMVGTTAASVADDPIQALIESEHMDTARQMIIQLESKLSAESSSTTRAAMLRRIDALKESFASKRLSTAVQLASAEYSAASFDDTRETVVTAEASKNGHGNSVIIGALHLTAFNATTGKLFRLRDSTGLETDEVECQDARIENSRDIRVSNLRCKNSLLMIKVNNSVVEATAQQVRLTDCHDILLTVFTRTGIFLQNCSGIRIRKTSCLDADGKANEYASVHDFTSPGSRANYTIID